MKYSDSLLGTNHDNIVAKNTGKTYRFIRNRRLELNIEPYSKKHGKNKAKYNDLCFHEINKVSAYWLGYLFADGCVYKKGKRKHLLLTSVDFEIIKNFQKFLKCPDSSISSNKIKDKKYYLACVSGRKTISKLEELGCVPRKTFILKKPNIPYKYFLPFILGYFDGDGSISLNRTINSWKASIGMASKKFFKWLKGVFDELKLKYSIEIRKIKSGNFYIFCLCGINAKLLLDTLYKSVPNDLPMKRKKDKYIEMSKSLKVRFDKYVKDTRK